MRALNIRVTREKRCQDVTPLLGFVQGKGREGRRREGKGRDLSSPSVSYQKGVLLNHYRDQCSAFFQDTLLWKW